MTAENLNTFTRGETQMISTHEDNIPMATEQIDNKYMGRRIGTQKYKESVKVKHSEYNSKRQTEAIHQHHYSKQKICLCQKFGNGNQ